MALAPPDHLRGRFVFLDALRGIAAVAVALFHFNNVLVSPLAPQFSALLPNAVLAVWRHLDLGVEIFFVLSGFVIAHSMAGHVIDARYAGNFILRRSIRLDPPYWVMITFTMGWPFALCPTWVPNFFADMAGWRGIVVNATYLQGILHYRQIIGVAWTLCLEVQFYLAFLAMLYVGHLLGRVKRQARDPFVATALTVLTCGSLHHWFSTHENNFIGRWWMFGSGVTIYLALRRNWPRWTVAAGLLAVLLTAAVQHEPYAMSATVTASVIFLVGSMGKLQTWLGWRWIQYLGRTSYSLYLVHLFVGIGALYVAQRFIDGSPTSIAWSITLAMFISLVAADLLHRTVEGPAARLAHRLRPQRQTNKLFA